MIVTETETTEASIVAIAIEGMDITAVTMITVEVVFEIGVTTAQGVEVVNEDEVPVMIEGGIEVESEEEVDMTSTIEIVTGVGVEVEVTRGSVIDEENGVREIQEVHTNLLQETGIEEETTIKGREVGAVTEGEVLTEEIQEIEAEVTKDDLIIIDRTIVPDPGHEAEVEIDRKVHTKGIQGFEGETNMRDQDRGVRTDHLPAMIMIDRIMAGRSRRSEPSAVMTI